MILTPRIASAVTDANDGITYANYAAGILIQVRAQPRVYTDGENEAIAYLSAAERDLRNAADKVAAIRERLERD